MNATTQSATQLSQRRAFNGWVPFSYHFGHSEVYSTPLAVDEEIWIALHKYSEIQDEGVKFILAKCPSVTKKKDAVIIWKEFRGYMRQAENFYNAAKPLSHKSSPLNYYYCFMNMGKAFLLINDLLLKKGVPKHGFYSTKLYGKSVLKKNKVVILQTDGIFPQLYEALYRTKLFLKTEFFISELLGYVSEIAVQLKQSNYPLKIFHARRVILSALPESWEFLGIPNALIDVWNISKLKSFRDRYRQVDCPKNDTRQFFDLHGYQHQHFSYFESATPATNGRYSVFQDTLKNAFLGAIEDKAINTGDQFSICMPYSFKKQIFMNEFLAIYSVMFFLSELVRYQPDIMDQISESRDAWIIESFIKTAPIMFLRYMHNKITGNTIIFQRY